jgi:hypothetical protein
VFENEGAAAAAAGFDGAHEACGAGSEDEDVDFGHLLEGDGPSGGIAVWRAVRIPLLLELILRMMVTTMRTPAGIKITTFLMAIVVFLHLVAILASPLPLRWNVLHGLFRFVITVLAAAVVGLAVSLFEAVALYFYWTGRRWARWAVLVGCLLSFVSLRHFIVGPSVSHARVVIIYYRMAVAGVVMAYLCTHGARTWFGGHARRGDLETE